MERNYWLGRERSALSMAHKSTIAEVKLIHFDLAGRYNLKALGVEPFMLHSEGSAAEGDRAALAIPSVAPEASAPRSQSSTRS
jgi:hypothetical protein